jgi:hypothetical protein
MDVIADMVDIVVTVARKINLQQTQKSKARIGHKVIITKERQLC